MKFEIDTRHDQPRFVRAVIALLLSALDDGSALPASVPPNLIPGPGEQLPDPKAVFGGGAPLAAPVPSTAVAPPPPIVPAAPPAISPPPPAFPTPVPPPAPVAPVPSAPVPPAPLASGVALDVEGLPWDARIHAASKSKIANGTWKLKKGMSEQKPFVDGVKAELRNTMAIPAGAPVPPVAAMLPPVLPPLAHAAPPAPPAAPAAAADPVDFASFMQWVAGLIHQGRWTHDHTTATLQQIGLPGAVALASRPDLIPQVVASIKAQLR